MVVAGLVLQLAALVAMLLAWRHNRNAILGPLFVAMAVAYHGLPELAFRTLSLPTFWRSTVPRQYLDTWVFLVSGAIAATTISYVLTRPRARTATKNSEPSQYPAATGLVALTTVAGLLTVTGVGYRGSSGGSAHWASAVVNELFLPMVVATSVIVVMRGNSRILPVVAVLQVALLTLVGQRLEVIAAALLTLLILRWMGRPIGGPQAVVVALICLVAVSLIMTTRSEFGRQIFKGGLEDRVRVVSVLQPSDGNSHHYASGSQPILERLDGNVFGGMIAQAFLTGGASPAGLEPFYRSFYVNVPQVVNPDKLKTPVTMRNEEAWIRESYNLPPVDLNPTLFGLASTYLGPSNLWLIGLIIGGILGAMDRLLRHARVPLSLLVVASLGLGISFYERGATALIGAVRTAALFTIIIGFFTLLSRLHKGSRPTGPGTLMKGEHTLSESGSK